MSITSLGATSSSLPATSVLGGTSAKKKPSAEDQFLKIAGETPQQRMFNSMLRQLGVTEDQFKAMSSEDQQKITQKVQEMIQQQAQNGGAQETGLVMDKSV